MSFLRKLFARGTSLKTKSDQSLQPDDINPLIARLLRDLSQHTDVGPRLSIEEIRSYQEKTGFHVPPSYSTFLREFGDGAYWLYSSQPMDSISQPAWLREVQPSAPESVPLEDGDRQPVASLFCLMSEDSNGGSWCWLTGKAGDSGEYPLAYYSREQKKLFYEVPSFVHWLYLLVSSRGEVIRALDTEERLGLG